MNIRNYTLWLVVFLVCLISCGGANHGAAPTLIAFGGSTITGRALSEVGTPVSGAKVALLTSGSQAQQTVQSTTTNATGYFAFSNLTAGTYTVSVSAPSSSGLTQTVLVSVSVSAGATVGVQVSVPTTINATGQNGAVFGTVTSTTGSPVVGTTVMLQSQSKASLPSLATTTSATGSFGFSSVTNGLWIVSVRGNQISSTTPQLITVQAGAASEVNITVTGNGNSGS
jgi:uncharacterized GH25 family protein